MLVKKIKKKVIPPKTYIHVCLEMVIHQTTSLNESWNVNVDAFPLFWKTCSSKFTLNYKKLNIVFLTSDLSIFDIIYYQ